MDRKHLAKYICHLALVYGDAIVGVEFSQKKMLMPKVTSTLQTPHLIRHDLSDGANIIRSC